MPLLRHATRVAAGAAGTPASRMRIDSSPCRFARGAVQAPWRTLACRSALQRRKPVCGLPNSSPMRSGRVDGLPSVVIEFCERDAVGRLAGRGLRVGEESPLSIRCKWSPCRRSRVASESLHRFRNRPRSNGDRDHAVRSLSRSMPTPRGAIRPQTTAGTSLGTSGVRYVGRCSARCVLPVLPGRDCRLRLSGGSRRTRNSGVCTLRTAHISDGLYRIGHRGKYPRRRGSARLGSSRHVVNSDAR